MRFPLLFGLLVLVSTPLRAEPTPEKAAEFAKRFAEGRALFDNGRDAEALKIFERILDEEPKARGALYFAAWARLNMNDADEAAELLERLLKLNPPVEQKFRALVLAIQANQSMRRTKVVETLRQQLYALRNSGETIPGLTDAKLFTREKIRAAKEVHLLITEGFDPQSEPFRVWQLDQFDASGQLLRTIALSYDAKSTAEFRQKDPAKNVAAEVYFLSEPIYRDGQTSQINVYRQELEKPSYETCRHWMLDALKKPPASRAIEKPSR
jgi:tetratricopeptide (TPR) repeat protein